MENRFDNRFDNKLNMLGILTTSTDNPNGRGDGGIFINSQSSLQFTIKRISRAPLNEETNMPKHYTGYLDSLCGGYETYDDVSLEDDKRIAKFRNEFEQKVFVFRGRRDSYYNVSKIQKETVIQPRTNAKGHLATQYVSLPVFQTSASIAEWERDNRISLKRNVDSYEDFISQLKKKNPIGLVEGFQEPMSSPFIIWCDVDNNEYHALGYFEKCIVSNAGYQFVYDYLGKISFSDEILKGTIHPIDFNPTILYMEEECYSELYNRFARHEVDEIISEAESSINAQTGNEVSTVEQPRNKEVFEIPADKTDESSLLELCRFHAHKNNLFYDFSDIINFHTAVKTRSLVILSGMSGTGKSRLVDTYARALNLKPEQTLIIPVRPSWNDDSDLLGYVDLNKMVYRPSETGFIELLIEANANPDQLYLVCFDEMNLARVEHYFSQFLSILEKPAGSERKLRIYSESLKGLYNASAYPNEIDIKDNIIFVGTVNIDESTYHFSDKVLDRSNVLQLKVLDYSTEWKKPSYGAPPNLTWSTDDFKYYIKEPDDNKYSEHRKCLWEIHNKLQFINSSLGVGPRVVKQIERYLCNIPSINIINKESAEKEGFDVQLVQRIFTKLRGSEDKLKKLYDVEADKCSILDDIFDKYAELSSFEKSRAALERKKEELRIYGYCI